MIRLISLGLISKYPNRLLVRKFKADKALSFRNGVHCEIKNLLKMEAFSLQIVINVLCTNKDGILGT